MKMVRELVDLARERGVRVVSRTTPSGQVLEATTEDGETVFVARVARKSKFSHRLERDLRAAVEKKCAEILAARVERARGGPQGR